MVSSPRLETVPGVVAFLTAALAREGINLKEFLSCYADTIFIVEKSQATKAYSVLSSFLQ